MVTSFDIEASSEDRSIHPVSFSTTAATGFLLDSVSRFLETFSMDAGNLHPPHPEKKKEKNIYI